MFKKTIFAITILCSLQQLFSAARNVEATDPIHDVFFNICIKGDLDALQKFLTKFKHQEGHDSFKSIINATKKEKSLDQEYTMLTLLVKVALQFEDTNSDPWEKLKILVSFKPNPNIGTELPLFTILSYFFKFNYSKKCLRNCTDALWLLRGLNQDFNYKHGMEESALDLIVKCCIPKQEIPIESILEITELLLQVGANPTIGTATSSNPGGSPAVDRTYLHQFSHELTYQKGRNFDPGGRSAQVYQLFEKYGFTSSKVTLSSKGIPYRHPLGCVIS